MKAGTESSCRHLDGSRAALTKFSMGFHPNSTVATTFAWRNFAQQRELKCMPPCNQRTGVQIHTSELGSHSMKITSVQCGRVATGRHDKRVVTVRVKLAQAEESMRITVVVPEEADDEAAWEYGIARAKDAARQFSACSDDFGIMHHLSP
jgi:hypothetical protein